MVEGATAKASTSWDLLGFHCSTDSRDREDFIGTDASGRTARAHEAGGTAHGRFRIALSAALVIILSHAICEGFTNCLLQFRTMNYVESGRTVVKKDGNVGVGAQAIKSRPEWGREVV
jgi:hypothetical protein